jgi:hypothetical protein
MLFGIVCHDLAWFCAVWHGLALFGIVWHHLATIWHRFGVDLHGFAWFGII